jgi:hypothetical protein
MTSRFSIGPVRSPSALNALNETLPPADPRQASQSSQGRLSEANPTRLCVEFDWFRSRSTHPTG